MSGFDDQIVREYFELHGFFVRQVRKYKLHSRGKQAEEEIDLLVHNPGWEKGQREPNFLLFASELPLIRQAVVTVKPWHSQARFTPKMLRSSSALFKFLDKNVIQQVEALFADVGDDDIEPDVLKILVLPGLPTVEPHRRECIERLREKGVDGIISFRTMLLDVVQKVEVNRNYVKSPGLQILKVLKNYELIKDPQMDLFPGN